ncbi:unnamed protein product [Vitrella brassicaformis CCMP3155]|uniref:Uncharacterized protein n=2 Tax=Vitrella brassicaformis TaxID=1169539 RepID=A0A0G4H7C0_VITBC|nr:unnamed protein product [Vitrella brassicaformis CCMP3155]|mmetsp:Transcript_35838/g.89266  ORF Transcript_35838/g.89266 Transcript_35838/m.89266 type:complete len:661 (+) Transcript_35838:173-2155(+)|eukprot:CEM39766.1 unnamed protein product [Vitrella brassicaformis CCMP3155]
MGSRRSRATRSGAAPVHFNISKGEGAFKDVSSLSQPLQWAAYLLPIAVVALTEGIQLVVCAILRSALMRHYAQTDRAASLLSALPLAVWLLKPFMGMALDAFGYMGEYRRPALVMTGLSAFLSLSSLLFVITHPTAFGDTMLPVLSSALYASAGLATLTTASEAITLQRARQQTAGGAAWTFSVSMAGRAVGLSLAILMSSLPLSAAAESSVLGFVSLVPLCISFAASLFNERTLLTCDGVPTRAVSNLTLSLDKDGLPVPAAPRSKPLREVWRSLSDYYRHVAVVGSLTYLFLMVAVPDVRPHMTDLLGDRFNWPTVLDAYLPFLAQLARLAGVALFQVTLYKLPFRTLGGLSTVASILPKAALALLLHPASPLTLPAHSASGTLQWLLLIDTALSTIACEALFLRLLLLGCRLCPEGLEATGFSTVAAVSTLGAWAARGGGGLVMQQLGVATWEGLWLTQVVIMAAYLLPTLAGVRVVTDVEAYDFSPSDVDDDESTRDHTSSGVGSETSPLILPTPEVNAFHHHHHGSSRRPFAALTHSSVLSSPSSCTSISSRDDDMSPSPLKAPEVPQYGSMAANDRRKRPQRSSARKSSGRRVGGEGKANNTEESNADQQWVIVEDTVPRGKAYRGSHHHHHHATPFGKFPTIRDVDWATNATL